MAEGNKSYYKESSLSLKGIYTALLLIILIVKICSSPILKLSWNLLNFLEFDFYSRSQLIKYSYSVKGNKISGR